MSVKLLNEFSITKEAEFLCSLDELLNKDNVSSIEDIDRFLEVNKDHCIYYMDSLLNHSVKPSFVTESAWIDTGYRTTEGEPIFASFSSTKTGYAGYIVSVSKNMATHLAEKNPKHKKQIMDNESVFRKMYEKVCKEKIKDPLEVTEEVAIESERLTQKIEVAKEVVAQEVKKSSNVSEFKIKDEINILEKDLQIAADVYNKIATVFYNTHPEFQNETPYIRFDNEEIVMLFEQKKKSFTISKLQLDELQNQFNMLQDPEYQLYLELKKKYETVA